MFSPPYISALLWGGQPVPRHYYPERPPPPRSSLGHTEPANSVSLRRQNWWPSGSLQPDSALYFALSFPQPASEQCVMEVSARRNCGYPGISPEDCASRHCCFSNLIFEVPWCFFPQSVEGNGCRWGLPGAWQEPFPPKLRVSPLCVCVYLCVCIPLCVCTLCICMCLSVCVYTTMRMCTSACVCNCVYAPLCVYVCASLCVCVHVEARV